MSYECKMGYANIPQMEDTQQEALKEEVGKRVKELHLAYEKKVEEISKQHLSEMVCVNLFSFLKLAHV